jgi:hypothetical protein
MPFASFSDIAALVDATEQSSGGLTVYFRCPRSGRVVQARGPFPDSTSRRFTQAAVGSIARSLLHRLSGVIRRHTGIYIPLGNVVRSHDIPGGDGTFATEADRQAATVAAFRSIAQHPGTPRQRGRFNLDGGQWVFVE